MLTALRSFVDLRSRFVAVAVAVVVLAASVCLLSGPAHAQDTTPPALVSGNTSLHVNGSAFTAIFDENLDTGSVPSQWAFSVLMNGVRVSIERVSIVDTQLLLDLRQAVEHWHDVHFIYNAPSTNPLQDAAGNDVVDMPRTSVSNITPDRLAPTLSQADAVELSGNVLSLNFVETLDGTSVPGASAFSVASAAGALTVSNVSVSGSSVHLWLTSAPARTDRVSVSYDPPSTGALRDASSNEAAAFDAVFASYRQGVRLVDGGVSSEGRLEVFYNGAWGTVCDDHWTQTNADVACRGLGYPLGANPGATGLAGGMFGQGAGTIVLDDVDCAGTEESVLDCPFGSGSTANVLGAHNCQVSDAVPVSCNTGTVSRPRVVSLRLDGTILSGGAYAANSPISATVTWSEPVQVRTVDGAAPPSIVLSYDELKTRSASYASGSGTSTTVFTHRIDSIFAQSISIPANALRLGGGDIVSVASSTRADLTHGRYPDVAEGPSVRDIAIVGDAGPDGQWSTGERVHVDVTFDRPVVVSSGGTPTVSLRLQDDPARVRTVSYVDGSNRATLRFTYTFAAADLNPSRLTVLANSLALGGATITGRPGALAATLGHAAVSREVASYVAATAEFSDLPSYHNGRTPFDVKLSFSADPDALSFVTMRDAMLAVRNATIVRARRATRGSDRSWILTVRPDNKEDIRLSLPRGVCPGKTSICFGDHPVAAAVSAEIPGLFGIEFTYAPSEHYGRSAPSVHKGRFRDGSTNVTVGMTLTMEPENRLQQWHLAGSNLYTITGGTLLSASHSATTSRRPQWSVTIEPHGNGPITITPVAHTGNCDDANSVCSARRGVNGGPPRRVLLQAAAPLVIPGPLSLTVADATVAEADGATLDFVVTLDRVRDTNTWVSYSTSDGTAKAWNLVFSESRNMYLIRPGDYQAVFHRRVLFPPGVTSRTVSVLVYDDDIDEGSETLTLHASVPAANRVSTAEGTGTITNTDALPEAWALRFGRTVGSQVVDALGHRLDASGESHLRLGGTDVSLSGDSPDSSAADELLSLSQGAKAPSGLPRVLTLDDLMADSAFHFSAASGDSGPREGFSAWGRVSRSSFEGSEGSMSLDGDVTTALLGVDAEWDGTLAGVMLSQSSGSGGYRAAAGRTGSVEADLTGVYPYGRISLDSGLSAWGLAGGGNGMITVRARTDEHSDAAASMKTDLSMRMGALGVEGRLYEGEGASPTSVDMRTDAMWVRTETDASRDFVATKGDVTRLRLAFDAKSHFAFGDSARMSPSFELGLRHDGGDAETGFGVEIGAGVSYTLHRLRLDARAHTLLAHEASGYRDWGMSASAALVPHSGGKGLTLKLSPQWGAASRTSDHLWLAPEVSRLASWESPADPSSGLVAEVGYGLSLPGPKNLLTPFAGATLSDSGTSALRTGARWNIGSDLSMQLGGTRTRTEVSRRDDAVSLRLRLRF